MNYCTYNELTFPYDKINQFEIKNNSIILEIILSSKEECFQIWEQLKQQKQNLIFSIYDNNLNLNFVLNQYYINDTILILKGEI